MRRNFGVMKDSARETFNLTSFDCIGWDLDHTLIRYNLKNLGPLLFDSMRKYMIEYEGYPKDLLKAFYNPEFGEKGIVIDRKLGKLLKIDKHACIVHAYHGTKKLTNDEVTVLYGKNRQLIGFDGSNHSRYLSLSTYFECPLAGLYAAMIDVHDKQMGGEIIVTSDSEQSEYDQHSIALFKAMEFNFGDWSKGWYFKEIASNPDKYLFKQLRVKEWIMELKQKHNKFLFLLTNSLPEYTHLLMDFSFGNDWVNLFDVINVNARKPRWFTSSEPYYAFSFVSNEQREYPGPQFPVTKVDNFSMSHFPGLYYGGNQETLLNELQRILKKESLSVCYFGDHIKNDVHVSKNLMKWATVAILEEMEGLHREDGSIEITGNDPLSSNPFWGCFFRTEHGNLTYWAREALEHSDLCIPSVAHMAQFPANTEFHHVLKHSLLHQQMKID